jgi:Holliday junction resolvase RusA-like endonuclease
MRRVAFTVYGQAQPKGSSRAFKRGARIIVTSDNPNLAKWEAVIRNEAQRVIETDPRIFEGPVALFCTFHFMRPPSVSAKRRPFPTVIPDLSKLVRAVEDPLRGVLIRDDCLVVFIAASKCYTDGPAKAELAIEDYYGHVPIRSTHV